MPLEDVLSAFDERANDLIDLHTALERLAEVVPRQARIVELRFFGGLDIDQAARVLGTSPATVKREWHLARMWLREQLC